MTETTAQERQVPAEQRTRAAQQILPLLEYLARVGRRSADARMSDCLRARHLIALNLLAEHGPMPQHAIGTALSLDPSNVVGLLNELEDRELIIRRRDPADRRRHIVELSAVGSGSLTQMFDALTEVEDELFRALSAEERATLHALLARAAETQAPGGESGPCTVADAGPCTVADCAADDAVPPC
jgi:DNA-binding MarR family transcriptional regulator